MKKDIYIFPRLLGIIISFFLVGSINISAQISGDYPYFESFLSGTQPAGIEKPTPESGMANVVDFSSPEGVILTPATLDKFGAFYLNNHQFDSHAGIFISFEYMVYEGDGGDGLSVFFFDADYSDPGIGAPGAGIGYTYNRAVIGGDDPTLSAQRSIGLKGAYMGIAFDSFGNFKKLFYQGEARVNGLPYNYGSPGTSELGPGTTNDVTIRGAMHPRGSTATGLSLGYMGYPVLVTQSTLTRVGHIMKTINDVEPGLRMYTWKQNNQLKAKETFTIRGGEAFTRPTDPGYRRAYIELFPNNDDNLGGFFVSVMIEHDNRRDTVIYNYKYTENFKYIENAINDGSPITDYNNKNATVRTGTTVEVDLDASVPDALKIGFAAATGSSKAVGGKKDKHVIKNLKLILPRAAEAYDDYVDDKYQGTIVTFKPLENDIGYTGTISRIQKPCPSCIDERSFRFVLDDGTEIYDDGADVIQHRITNMGIWRYDKTNGEVTFTPDQGFVDKEATIRYNIKGGKDGSPGGEYPYNQESYRSTPATIGVKIITNPNPPGSTFMISNKMVTSRFKK